MKSPNQGDALLQMWPDWQNAKPLAPDEIARITLLWGSPHTIFSIINRLAEDGLIATPTRTSMVLTNKGKEFCAKYAASAASLTLVKPADHAHALMLLWPNWQTASPADEIEYLAACRKLCPSTLGELDSLLAARGFEGSVEQAKKDAHATVDLLQTLIAQGLIREKVSAHEPRLTLTSSGKALCAQRASRLDSLR